MSDPFVSKFKVIEWEAGKEPPIVLESRAQRADFYREHADMSLEQLYEMARRDWSDAEVQFPDREAVLNALYSISKLDFVSSR